jgi:hypothetical protein
VSTRRDGIARGPPKRRGCRPRRGWRRGKDASPWYPLRVPLVSRAMGTSAPPCDGMLLVAEFFRRSVTWIILPMPFTPPPTGGRGSGSPCAIRRTHCSSRPAVLPRGCGCGCGFPSRRGARRRASHRFWVTRTASNAYRAASGRFASFGSLAPREAGVGSQLVAELCLRSSAGAANGQGEWRRRGWRAGGTPKIEPLDHVLDEDHRVRRVERFSHEPRQQLPPPRLARLEHDLVSHACYSAR